jgi:hypothetical protein
MHNLWHARASCTTFGKHMRHAQPLANTCGFCTAHTKNQTNVTPFASVTPCAHGTPHPHVMPLAHAPRLIHTSRLLHMSHYTHTSRLVDAHAACTLLDLDGVSAGRVDGGLAVSRAFGDFVYKQRSDLGQGDQKVSATPQVDPVERVPSRDSFLLLVRSLAHSHPPVPRLARCSSRMRLSTCPWPWVD